MPTYLRTLALKNYRGIGASEQRMAEFRDFNFFIGANNAGKSTVLSFISSYIPITWQSNASASDLLQLSNPLEHHGGNLNEPIEMAIGFTSDQVCETLIDKYSNIVDGSTLSNTLRVLIQALSEEGLIWKRGVVAKGKPLSINNVSRPDLEDILSFHQWRDLWQVLSNHTGGDLRAHWIPETMKLIDDALHAHLPPTKIIPAIRQVGPTGEKFEDFSGAGLIDQLASLQNPDFDRSEDRKKFMAINRFLREVTDRPEATIEIPHSRDHLLVNMDSRVLPLSALGTGIHEVIMIAAFCTITEKEIVCIEEPEIHLHPILQRKLILYLKNNTNNQYFIATHSASFIDTPGAAIFHVYQKDRLTHIREAILDRDKHTICVDLGHRASDIVQANSLIWVEGPSDRIYINHWINCLDPTLIEGVHYSIMFYGGRLLSHLSADDDEITDFIKLRNLNRNLGIVIDSDKRTARDGINATKKRIIRDFKDHGGFVWLTKGREIENYIDHARLQQAVAALYRTSYSSPSKGGQFDHPLHFHRITPARSRKVGSNEPIIQTAIDKVKVSRIVVNDGMENLKLLDLKNKASELVDMIKNANR